MKMKTYQCKNQKYDCDQCDKSYEDKIYLKQCDNCQYAAYTKREVLVHIKRAHKRDEVSITLMVAGRDSY